MGDTRPGCVKRRMSLSPEPKWIFVEVVSATGRQQLMAKQLSYARKVLKSQDSLQITALLLELQPAVQTRQASDAAFELFGVAKPGCPS